MRALAAAVLVLVLTWSPALPAQARLGVTAELGPELDTNATRIYTIRSLSQGPTASGLVRLTARAELAARLGSRNHLTLVYGGGGKLFWDGGVGETENELVQHGSLDWVLRLPPGLLWANGSYYDSFQSESQRDFRSGSGFLRYMMTHPPSHTRTHLQLGFRGLQFKPDTAMGEAECVETNNPLCARHSFHGPVAGLGLRWDLTTRGIDQVDWTLGVSYDPAFRAYDSLIRGLREKCPSSDPTVANVCSYFKEGQRQDFNHLLRLQLDYRGSADFSLWYSAEVNRSNSFGSSYVRHAVGLKFTAALLWDIYLTTKGVFQLRQDADPYLLSLGEILQERDQSFLSLEDENRSSLVIQLAREITGYLSVLVRYSLYVSEGVSLQHSTSVELPSYSRHTIFAGLRLELTRELGSGK